MADLVEDDIGCHMVDDLGVCGVACIGGVFPEGVGKGEACGLKELLLLGDLLVVEVLQCVLLLLVLGFAPLLNLGGKFCLALLALFRGRFRCNQ